MSNRPTCNPPKGPAGTTAQVIIPPGWYTYVSGLGRNCFAQTIRMQIKNGKGTNTETLVHNPNTGAAPNEMMKLTSGDKSHIIEARNDEQILTVTAYYATNKDPNADVTDIESQDIQVVKGLTICKAATPTHLLKELPDFVTFFVFVQASADQEATEDVPLYNDAVCTINMFKGTKLDHDGVPVNYAGKSKAGNGVGNNSTTGGTTTGSGTTGAGATGGGLKDTNLDIVFVQDCTSSQQPYIKASIDNIINISTTIASSAKLAHNGLRLGLIGFRDVGASDEFVTKPFPFTSDVSVMKNNLSTLVAAGGGDYPEAVAEALDAALHSQWRPDATKLVILITDAPPHGIEPNDQPSQGSPAGKEPLGIVRRMAEAGITLHLVACEPTLSKDFKYALDFYTAATKIAGGLVFPLVSASKLADYIIGSSLERVELDALVAKYGKTIARRAVFGKKESPEALAKAYHAQFVADGVTVTTLEIEKVYQDYSEGRKNVETYCKAASVAAACPLLDVPGARLLPKFASGSVSPSVTQVKRPVSEAQTSRVVNLSINKYSKEVDSQQVIGAPTFDEPVENSFTIKVPAGWHGFVTALSRAKYNQTLKINHVQGSLVNNNYYMISGFNQTDETMCLEQSRGDNFYTFVARPKPIVLTPSFFWSKEDSNGEALDEDESDQYRSKKLKVVMTETPERAVKTFPNYVTYFIMAEDQAEADQAADVPEFNDCVGIVYLIKNTLMVRNEN
ncbi:hypothetical protein D9619_009927 [Psilocybe cf. subviscida]|uniref:VWFA domain-containing protein n=1 Tax=Psilocybe cf. subviscida TaxID=2480587 RepID=A0A8H5BL12_9AGAR|nr:hypothetical protein D9619_009927 [Psilocybe cf. subviscida]